jgi:hypothetical protein
MGIERRRQVDPPSSSDEIGPRRVRNRDRQARLSRAAGPGQGQNSGAPNQRPKLAQRSISPHESGQPHRQIPERRFARLSHLSCGFLDQ